MKIGITGAGGFIGSYLVKYLKQNSYDVLPLLRGDGDLNSRLVCEDFISEVDTIIHLANVNTIAVKGKNSQEEIELNLLPTLNILEAIEKSKAPKHLIYASSAAVYGRSSNIGKPISESVLPEPVSIYGHLKLIAENYISLYSQNTQMVATILRIANPYGVLLPGKKQGVISNLLNKVLKNEPMRVFNASSIRDYIHISDLARVFELCLQKQENRESSTVYNVGSGKGYSIEEIISFVESI